MSDLVGRKPDEPPPRSVDFDELEKKMIDVLVDSIKYIATTCGIVIAIYSQILQGYLRSQSLSSGPFAQFLIFTPLLLWFISILGTIVGIYPRPYKAITDFEKQKAIDRIRTTKRFWLIVVLYFFVSGFALFLYLIGAQLWRVYPFGS